MLVIKHSINCHYYWQHCYASFNIVCYAYNQSLLFLRIMTSRYQFRKKEEWEAVHYNNMSTIFDTTCFSDKFTSKPMHWSYITIYTLRWFDVISLMYAHKKVFYRGNLPVINVHKRLRILPVYKKIEFGRGDSQTSGNFPSGFSTRPDCIQGMKATEFLLELVSL